MKLVIVTFIVLNIFEIQGRDFSSIFDHVSPCIDMDYQMFCSISEMEFFMDSLGMDLAS